MDFTYSEDEQALADLAAKVFDDHGSDDAIRAFDESGAPYDARLWSALAEAGLLGVAIGEEHGGSGMGLLALALVLQQQGRTVTQVPLLSTLVSVGLAIAKFGSEYQREHLGKMATGQLIAAAALEQPGGLLGQPPALRAEASGNGWQLWGELAAVPYAAQADLILVPARTDEGIIVALIPTDAEKMAVESQAGTSGEPLALVTLDSLEITGDMLLGDQVSGAQVLAFIVQHTQVGLCALQVGLTSEALRRTAEYTSERVQFGRPIGSMQAVQQRAADAFIDVEAMRSTMLRAVWALEEGEAEPAEIAAAKYWAAVGGHRVTHTAQHLHGGMGADVTYPIHRFLLNAKRIELALGGAAPTLDFIGRQIAAGSTRPLAATGVEA